MKEETRRKWENFWYYYRIHVIVGIVVVAVVATGFLLGGPKGPQPDLTASVIGNVNLMQEQVDALSQTVGGMMVNDVNGDGEKVAWFDFVAGADNSPEMRQVIQLEMIKPEVRLVIMDAELFESFGNERYMEDVSAIARTYGIDAGGPVYGLPLPADCFLSEYFPTDGLYICVKVRQVGREDDRELDLEYENAYAVLDQIF